MIPELPLARSLDPRERARLLQRSAGRPDAYANELAPAVERGREDGGPSGKTSGLFSGSGTGSECVQVDLHLHG